MSFTVSMVMAMLILVIFGIGLLVHIMDGLSDIYKRLEELEKKLNERK